MQMTSRFTIAIHIISCIDYFKDTVAVTSNFLADSIGVNPVIVRTVLGKLKQAGMIDSQQGKSGIRLARPLEQINFYDLYRALEIVDETGLFHFHEQPNLACPVGRTIHAATDEKLWSVQRAMEAQLKQITMQAVQADLHVQLEQRREASE